MITKKMMEEKDNTSLGGGQWNGVGMQARSDGITSESGLK